MQYQIAIGAALDAGLQVKKKNKGEPGE